MAAEAEEVDINVPVCEVCITYMTYIPQGFCEGLQEGEGYGGNIHNDRGTGWSREVNAD